MSVFSMMGRVPAVAAGEVSGHLEGGAVVVDVREPVEWDAGRAPMARHIPLGSFAREARSLPSDRTIIVVCRSGNRSRAAVQALVDAGYDARNLNGGMKAWVRSGLPVVADHGRMPMIV